MSDHLDSSAAEIDQIEFLRMFALGCFDAFITLPINSMGLVINIVATSPLFTFYQGWTFIHSEWGPVLTPKSLWSTTKFGVFSVYWNEWINPFFALVFFALFGLTPGARKGYRTLFRALRRLFGAKQGGSTEEGLPDVVFKSGRGTNTTATSNVSSRYVSSILSAR